MAQKIENINIDNLKLWTENPRDAIDTEANDLDIINKALLDNKNKWNLQGLLDKMGNHYDYSELPTVVKKGDNYIVYDGNRRVAVLKYLQNKELQDSLSVKLKIGENQQSLSEVTSLPCNICDVETALINIERNHLDSGDWGRLERDYFLTNHRKENKSNFVLIDEQTNLISSFPFLNKRFVKEELFIPEVLSKIGLNINEKDGLVTIYDKKTTNKILEDVTNLIKNKKISTRSNRKDILKPLLKHNPELKEIIKPYNEKNKQKVKSTYAVAPKTTSKRRTPKEKETNVLFGKELYLKKGRVNNLYIGIDKVFKQNKSDDYVLPIIAMSLRLLLETAAREYYKEHDPKISNNDQIYKDFLKLAKKNMGASKETENFLSLTDDWMSSKISLEAALGKYAHGNIIVTRSSVLKESTIIGDIINFYFRR